MPGRVALPVLSNERRLEALAEVGAADFFRGASGEPDLFTLR